MQESSSAEAIRQLQICNACRYCEGYCSVWDALDRRHDLSASDAYYFSSLCHDCRECYVVCPFTEPHEYAINIPKILGTVRLETYEENVKPGFMKAALRHPFSISSAVTALSLAGVFLFILLEKGGISLNSTYTLPEVISPQLYRLTTVPVYIYVVGLWVLEGHSYWKSISSEKKGPGVGIMSVLKGIYDAFSHRNFRGGGAGCNFPSEKGGNFRLIFHPMVFFGFIAALISISFYPDTSPVISYSYLAGSLLMFIGASALITGKEISWKSAEVRGMRGIDMPFSILISLSGITGVLLILFLGSGHDWIIFGIHDALVLSLFLLAPFGKFIHPVFRILALIKNRSESTNPS
jgi:citrate/tricarballylate utilization protein